MLYIDALGKVVVRERERERERERLYVDVLGKANVTLNLINLINQSSCQL